MKPNKLYNPTLDSLEDVEADAASNYDHLEYNGSAWVNVSDVTIAGTLASNAHTINSTDGSDSIVISHDNSNANIQWDDGRLLLETNEGTNTNSSVRINGHGTGAAFYQLIDGGSSAILTAVANGSSQIYTEDGGELRLQHTSNGSIKMFDAAADAEEQALQISGFPTGDAKYTMSLTHNSITSTYNSISFGDENLSTTGSVGIGAAANAKKLYVFSDAGDSAIQIQTTHASSQSEVNFNTVGGSGLFQLDQSGNMIFRTQQSGMFFDSFGSGTINFRTGGANSRMTINSAGLVAIANDLHVLDNISVGTASPSGGFSGAGDIYATSGIKAMEGLYSEAVAYGAGLEVADNSQATTYTSPIPGTATLTVATQTLTQAGVNFTTEGVEVGMFLKVITATTASGSGQYIGATGEIIAIPSATTLVLSFGAAGGHSLLDATSMAYVIYPEPLFWVGDHGDIHSHVGTNPDASFKVCAEGSTNDHAVHLDIIAGADGNTGFDIEYDPDDHGGTAAMHINFDATDFDLPDTIGTGIDVVIDNTGATNGDVHVMDVALSDPANSDLEVEAIVTHEGVDVIAQYLGEPAVLTYGAVYDASVPSYTDRTTEFNSNASDIAIFVEQNDAIFVASASKFDEINILNQVDASHSIIPTFHYIKADGTEVAFSPADDCNGFSQNGTIRFESDNLTDWGQRTVAEVTGLTGSTDYYWVKITRTRKVLPTSPTEDTIQVTSIGDRHGWDSVGRLAIKTYSQSAEPDTDDIPANSFCFWIDTDDSKLYICYNQSGTIKTSELT